MVAPQSSDRSGCSEDDEEGKSRSSPATATNEHELTSQTAKEAAFVAAADIEEYERSFGEGASENKAQDTAQVQADKITDAAKKAAAEADAQVQSYQDAELGLPQGNPKKGSK